MKVSQRSSFGSLLVGMILAWASSVVVASEPADHCRLDLFKSEDPDSVVERLARFELNEIQKQPQIPSVTRELRDALEQKIAVLAAHFGLSQEAVHLRIREAKRRIIFFGGRKAMSRPRDLDLEQKQLPGDYVELRRWEWKSSGDRIHAWAFAPDGKRLFLGKASGALEISEVDSDATPRVVQLFSSGKAITSLATDGKDRVIVARSGDVAVWDAHAQPAVRSFEGIVPIRRGQYGIEAISMSRDGKLAAWATSSGRVQVWDFEAGHVVLTFLCQANDLSFSASGDSLVTGGAAGMQLWSLKRRAWWRRLAGFRPVQLSSAKWINSVAFIGNSGRVISAPRVEIWDIETAKSIGPFPTHVDNFFVVAISADSKRAIGIDQNFRVFFWEVELGRVTHIHSGGGSVAMSDDGKRAVVGPSGGAIRLLEYRSTKDW